MNGQHFYERCMRCDCVNSELVCQTDADCEDDGCSGGRIWNDCVLCSSEITCQNHHFRESLCDASGNTLCSIGGCRCPGSTVFHNDSCIDVTECPCDVEGHAVAQGEIWGDDCNQWYEPPPHLFIYSSKRFQKRLSLSVSALAAKCCARSTSVTRCVRASEKLTSQLSTELALSLCRNQVTD